MIAQVMMALVAALKVGWQMSSREQDDTGAGQTGDNQTKKVQLSLHKLQCSAHMGQLLLHKEGQCSQHAIDG
jgi:hypothetical protein